MTATTGSFTSTNGWRGSSLGDAYRTETDRERGSVKHCGARAERGLGEEGFNLSM